ncbi:MAG: sigma-70 factor domain-containing protein, partial [Sulfuricella sp.]|nr:sigma-70 factor domain-containing protein [Sulfuricella sp.]
MSDDIFGEEEEFPGVEKAALDDETVDVAPELKESPSEHQSDPTLIYLNEIGQNELLSAAEEYSLACRVTQGDFDARQRMIECNLRLV